MFQEMLAMGAGGDGGKSLVVSEASISDNSGRVECGFEPKHILIASPKYAGNIYQIIYCEGGKSATGFIQYYNGARYTDSIGAGKQITNIDSTGFDVGFPSYWNNGYSFMIVTEE